MNRILHEKERAALNTGQLKSTSVDLPQCMTIREKEMYGVDVSATLISKVTDAVIEQVVEW